MFLPAVFFGLAEEEAGDLVLAFFAGGEGSALADGRRRFFGGEADFGAGDYEKDKRR